MRRADRLLQIILHLRSRRFATARDLAEALEVSQRTVYRDMADLLACGVPIDGEAGVGYRLRRGFDLPPLMFDREELQALLLGARMVKSWSDGGLGRAADYALAKIEAVLPEERRSGLAKGALYAMHYHPYPVDLIGPLRTAIDSRRRVRFDYVRADGAPSTRSVRPLGLFFWGATWTLTAWCELRDNFRHFRLDRMSGLALLEEHFKDQPGQTLEDFFRSMDCELD